MAAINDFQGANRIGISDPAEHAFLITPHATDELSHVTRAISFATAGILHVVTAEGDEVQIPSGSLAAGIMHSLRVKRVISPATAASGIVGYY